MSMALASWQNTSMQPIRRRMALLHLMRDLRHNSVPCLVLSQMHTPSYWNSHMLGITRPRSTVGVSASAFILRGGAKEMRHQGIVLPRLGDGLHHHG